MTRRKHHPLFLISGLTCAGKRMLLQHVLRTYPSVQHIVTTTDRPALPGEQEGVDHFFMTPEEFTRQEKAGAFIETSPVHGYSYGVSSINVEHLRQQGPVCMIVNPCGAIEISEALSHTNKVYGIFVLADMPGIRKRINERSLTQKDANASMEEITEELSHSTSSYFDLVVNMSDRLMNASIGAVLQFIGQKLSH